MRDRRLAEADADLAETSKIAIGQIGVAFTDVVDGLVHPVLLVFNLGMQHTATIDMAEQLVACPLHEFLFTQTSLRLSFQERAFGAPFVVFIR